MEYRHYVANIQGCSLSNLHAIDWLCLYDGNIVSPHLDSPSTSYPPYTPLSLYTSPLHSSPPHSPLYSLHHSSTPYTPPPLPQDREASFRLAPGTSMFLHWMVGMLYVFYFASFIILLREVVRPGVLWFLRNLNDPDFNPVQEVRIELWGFRVSCYY